MKEQNEQSVQINQNLTQNREIWPDMLRIIAAFFVVFLHSASAGMHGFYGYHGPDSSAFQFCNFYASITRWTVPVFVMLSGMFFLDLQKEYTLKKLYSKKVFCLHMLQLLFVERMCEMWYNERENELSSYSR